LKEFFDSYGSQYYIPYWKYALPQYIGYGERWDEWSEPHK